MSGGGTEILVRHPDPRLAGAVLAIYGYSETTDGPMRRRELPGTRVVMTIELGPAISILDGSSGLAACHPLGFVAGLALAPVFTETVGHQRGLQVMFTALGAGRLLGVPVGVLAGSVVGIGVVLGASGRDFVWRLRDAPDWPARFALVEAWLLARAIAARELPPELAFAVDALDRYGGALPIRGLARAAGCSERLLERRFTAELGLPPKRFARLTRFEAAVARLSAGGSPAAVAAEGGFVDQAHLIHEIRAFSGLSPGALLRARLPGEGGLAA